MDKRFQVFVSSTYADLKEERQHVIQALMEVDCIPAGMELFPAADEEQWKFIKRVIDDCDYYLLIIGGRYGSTTDDGISYTEKEFDYAVERGLKIVALIHDEPNNIPLGKSEQSPAMRNKLEDFKNKVRDGRLVKTWRSAEELPGLVVLSMTKTVKMYPAIGWVRANHVANESILQEINELRKENFELQNKLKDMAVKPELTIDGIANIDSKFTIHGSYDVYRSSHENRRSDFASMLSWKELFSLIAPCLMKHPNDAFVKGKLTSVLLEREGKSGHSISIDDQDFQTVTIQLKAYGLVRTEYSKSTTGQMALFWSLTSKGEQFMIESRVIRESD